MPGKIKLFCIQMLQESFRPEGADKNSTSKLIYLFIFANKASQRPQSILVVKQFNHQI